MNIKEEKIDALCQELSYLLCMSKQEILNRLTANNNIVDKSIEWFRDNWREYVIVDADGMVCFGHWENDYKKAMGH